MRNKFINRYKMSSLKLNSLWVVNINAKYQCRLPTLFKVQLLSRRRNRSCQYQWLLQFLKKSKGLYLHVTLNAQMVMSDSQWHL